MKSEIPLPKIQLKTTFEVHAVGAVNAIESIYLLLWVEIRQCVLGNVSCVQPSIPSK